MDDLALLKEERERLIAIINQKWQTKKRKIQNTPKALGNGNTLESTTTHLPTDGHENVSDALHNKSQSPIRTQQEQNPVAGRCCYDLLKKHQAELELCQHQLALYRDEIAALTTASLQHERAAHSQSKHVTQLNKQLATLRELLFKEQENKNQAHDSKQFGHMPEQFYATPSSPVLPASRALCDGNMELGKMRAALLKEERSTRTLTAHLAKITTEHESLKKKLILERRSTERITAKLHSQLKGAVRYIQWLVQQQHQATNTAAEREDYISKLEKKLLQYQTTFNQHKPGKFPKKADPASVNSTLAEIDLFTQQLEDMIGSMHSSDNNTS